MNGTCSPDRDRLHVGAYATLGAAAAWPFPARAQQPGGVRRVGVLTNGVALERRQCRAITDLCGAVDRADAGRDPGRFHDQPDRDPASHQHRAGRIPCRSPIRSRKVSFASVRQGRSPRSAAACAAGEAWSRARGSLRRRICNPEMKVAVRPPRHRGGAAKAEVRASGIADWPAACPRGQLHERAACRGPGGLGRRLDPLRPGIAQHLLGHRGFFLQCIGHGPASGPFVGRRFLSLFSFG
jgi:hypothetical protein